MDNKDLLNGINSNDPLKKALRLRILKCKLDQIDELEEKIESVKNIPRKSDFLPKEIVIGSLVYGLDGTIKFKSKILEMRPQIKTLCILLMKNHGNSVDYSRIKDELISTKKRSSTGFKTITKYAGELHKILEIHFKKKVIFNFEKEGYILDVNRKNIKMN